MLDTAEQAGDTSPDAIYIKELCDTLSPQGALPTIAELNAAAKRLVAAECTAFLLNVNVNANVQREAWEPYREWAQGVDAAGDVVITFNYDTVAERLGMLPFIVGGDNQHKLFRKAPLLKLHGSVDWERIEGVRGSCTFRRHEREPEYALTCDDSQLSIGTPGPCKAAVSTQLSSLLYGDMRRTLSPGRIGSCSSATASRSPTRRRSLGSSQRSGATRSR